PPRSPGALLQACDHSPRNSLLGFGRERAHLDGAGRRRRAARSPIERRVEREKLENRESRELLLGIGIGAVLDETPTILPPDRRPSLGQVQRTAIDVDAGFDQSLVVGAPGAEVGIVFPVLPARESLRTFIDEHRVLHFVSCLITPGTMPNGMTRGKRRIRPGDAKAGSRASSTVFQLAAGDPGIPCRPLLLVLASLSLNTNRA